MATITEDYVSYEVAKLLKEKGFNGTCWSWYHNGNHTFTGTSRYCNNELDKHDYSKPTIQMAMKWLREVHKMFISIIYESDGVFVANLKIPSRGVDVLIDRKHNCWFTYEEAASEAIMCCLENLN